MYSACERAWCSRVTPCLADHCVRAWNDELFRRTASILSHRVASAALPANDVMRRGSRGQQKRPCRTEDATDTYMQVAPPVPPSPLHALPRNCSASQLLPHTAFVGSHSFPRCATACAPKTAQPNGNGDSFIFVCPGRPSDDVGIDFVVRGRLGARIARDVPQPCTVCLR